MSLAETDTMPPELPNRESLLESQPQPSNQEQEIEQDLKNSDPSQ